MKRKHFMATSTSIPPAPWGVEYLPYTAPDGSEIPNFRINDANADTVCETNENLPASVQEKAADLIAASPELLDTLDYFFNIMHDYKSSVRKGYVKHAMDLARAAIARAKGGRV
jgi:hypothetical protein